MTAPNHATSSPLPVTRLRDLLIADVPASRLVIACDTTGGIGPRPDDSYPADPIWCAHLAARVPLLEVLCVGARPLILVDTLCQDEESARPMIEEFRRCAVSAGMGPEAVTGSTEDNVVTTQTGIGVTIIGVMPEGEFPRTHHGDALVCLGAPISAPDDDVSPGRREIVTVEEVRRLVDSGKVHDCAPVGSHGVAWEAEQLAATTGLRATFRTTDVDLAHSGGPSTCIVLACAPYDVKELHGLVTPERPWEVIGGLA
ncbi:AIR synthase related protein [Cutibacterium sp.]|uniref:AIR synthase related protein n=1 Tax=Cutibacterium sp. TaxID=1912221 RepID=UPI0026DA7A3C|nr:AIR synthase related protein [Cutibacterium sp.]MDO4412626.1 transcriptional regulator [Cutibacterium sp.]